MTSEHFLADLGKFFESIGDEIHVQLANDYDVIFLFTSHKGNDSIVSAILLR